MTQRRSTLQFSGVDNQTNHAAKQEQDQHQHTPPPQMPLFSVLLSSSFSPSPPPPSSSKRRLSVSGASAASSSSSPSLRNGGAAPHSISDRVTRSIINFAALPKLLTPRNAGQDDMNNINNNSNNNVAVVLSSPGAVSLSASTRGAHPATGGINEGQNPLDMLASSTKIRRLSSPLDSALKRNSSQLSKAAAAAAAAAATVDSVTRLARAVQQQREEQKRKLLELERCVPTTKECLYSIPTVSTGAVRSLTILVNQTLCRFGGLAAGGDNSWLHLVFAQVPTVEACCPSNYEVYSRACIEHAVESYDALRKSLSVTPGRYDLKTLHLNCDASFSARISNIKSIIPVILINRHALVELQLQCSGLTDEGLSLVFDALCVTREFPSGLRDHLAMSLHDNSRMRRLAETGGRWSDMSPPASRERVGSDSSFTPNNTGGGGGGGCGTTTTSPTNSKHNNNNNNSYSVSGALLARGGDSPTKRLNNNNNNNNIKEHESAVVPSPSAAGLQDQLKMESLRHAVHRNVVERGCANLRVLNLACNVMLGASEDMSRKLCLFLRQHPKVNSVNTQQTKLDHQAVLRVLLRNRDGVEHRDNANDDDDDDDDDGKSDDHSQRLDLNGSLSSLLARGNIFSTVPYDRATGLSTCSRTRMKETAVAAPAAGGGGGGGGHKLHQHHSPSASVTTSPSFLASPSAGPRREPSMMSACYCSARKRLDTERSPTSGRGGPNNNNDNNNNNSKPRPRKSVAHLHDGETATEGVLAAIASLSSLRAEQLKTARAASARTVRSVSGVRSSITGIPDSSASLSSSSNRHTFVPVSILARQHEQCSTAHSAASPSRSANYYSAASSASSPTSLTKEQFDSAVSTFTSYANPYSGLIEVARVGKQNPHLVARLTSYVLAQRTKIEERRYNETVKKGVNASAIRCSRSKLPLAYVKELSSEIRMASADAFAEIDRNPNLSLESINFITYISATFPEVPLIEIGRACFRFCEFAHTNSTESRVLSALESLPLAVTLECIEMFKNIDKNDKDGLISLSDWQRVCSTDEGRESAKFMWERLGLGEVNRETFIPLVAPYLLSK